MAMQTRLMAALCAAACLAGCGGKSDEGGAPSPATANAQNGASPAAKIVGAIGEASRKSHIAAAQAQAMAIYDAVITYRLKHGKRPSNLSALTDDSGDDEPILKGGEGALQDPWGNEYKLEAKGKKHAIVSAGPDGEFGTSDDIRSGALK